MYHDVYRLQADGSSESTLAFACLSYIQQSSALTFFVDGGAGGT